MGKLKNGIRWMLRDPWFAVRKFCYSGALDGLSDEMYMKILFRATIKHKLNLEDPKSFNEKLNWLKFHDRKDEYSLMVDKYEAKKWVADRIGTEHVIPSYGVWERFEDIDFATLPDSFVLKTTHDSGGVVICRDKSKLNIEQTKQTINRSLAHNWYKAKREWPYKNVKPRIIAEEYLSDLSSDTLTDYKIFCFDGEPKIILTVMGGHLDESKVVRRMYSPDWTLYPVGLHGKEPVTEPEPKPKELDEMLSLASKLSSGLKHLRVDFYDVGGHIYFGELTFYHMGGLEIYKPYSYDLKFGEFLKL